MLIIFGVTLFCIATYAILISKIRNSWSPNKISHALLDDFPFVSVIIAARNEEANIKHCLDSLVLSSYPKDHYEIIVIDDMSTDQTPDIVKSHSCKCVKYFQLNEATNKGSKKQALAYAAQVASGEIWMYTDADSIVSPHWISKCVKTLTNKPETSVILGPVSYVDAKKEIDKTSLNTLISKWQQLDIMGMMAVTNAGLDRKQWYIGNGANLAIRANLWNQVGYDLDAKHQYASGDDVTLVQGAANLDKQSIHYILDQGYIVKTSLQPNLASLLRQRLRWTSKNNVQSSNLQKVVMGMTWLICLWTLIMGVLSVMHWQYIIAFALLIVSKAIIDLYYLTKIQSFFKSDISRTWMLILSPLHTLYVALFGLLALFPQRYTWKGRNVK